MAKYSDDKYKKKFEDLCLFISCCSTKSKSKNNYTDFKRINVCLTQLFPDRSNVNILDFDDPFEFVEVIDRLNNNKLYKTYNKTGNNQYSNAVSVYLT